jgi:hypothetical protein
LKIGLWSDAVNFPSLPLMKLSAYHKECGENVHTSITNNSKDVGSEGTKK